MNIFVLDEDFQKCSQYHNNKHVVKMIVEYAQLLCNSHWLSNSQAPYKLTHKNHPCSKWVVESIENYNWLLELLKSLCKEYTFRYNKIHKTEKEIIPFLEKNKPNISNISRTEFKLAMPDHCKLNDVISSYRNYYKIEKRHIASWKSREVPNWFLT